MDKKLLLFVDNDFYGINYWNSAIYPLSLLLNCFVGNLSIIKCNSNITSLILSGTDKYNVPYLLYKSMTKSLSRCLINNVALLLLNLNNVLYFIVLIVISFNLCYSIWTYVIHCIYCVFKIWVRIKIYIPWDFTHV